MTVTGTDLLGNSLIPGGVPNPWSFTANRKPVVQITTPGVGERRTASTSLTIAWTMTDGTETPVANLRVWLIYTFAGGFFTPIPGAQGLTGLTPPHTFGWTTPASDGDLIVYLEVSDGVGELGQDPSDTVVVDATAPTVSSTVPADGATNVATNANIVITFSEAMDIASAEGAITVPPAVTYTAAWTVGDTVLTLSHAVAFTTNTPYQLRIGVTASDTANPGLGLAAEYVLDFTTGAGPRRPNPPRNFDKTSETASAIGLRWDPPATWTDGSALLVSDLDRYLIYRSTSSTDTNPTQVGSVDSPTTAFTDSSVVEGTQYYYWVRAVDVNNGESNLSAMVGAKAGVGPPEPFNWLLVLIPLIVILVIVGLFLLMRKKKPEAVPPKEAAVKEEAEEAPAEEPTETAEEPAEEAGKAEEGGEKFVPCPNCGTMVKPTDAECFVCGAKL